MSDFYKQCQSCGMPLKDGTDSGTEANGEKSKKYCKFCYGNGQFLQPEITLDEMKKVVDGALKEKGWLTPFRWLSLQQLPTLERWKSK